MMGSTITPPEMDIALVNAKAFHYACKDAASEPMVLMAVHSEVAMHSTKVESKILKSPSTIPKEYADFADVFDEIAVDELLEHCPYDLKIKLESGSAPPLGRIYPLSKKELQAL